MGTSRRRRPRWLGTGFCLALALACGAEAAAPTPACVAWPGEPEPLPSAHAADALAARWAADRAAALGSLARELAPGDPDAARRLYAHALCLDSERPLDRAALAALHPEHRSRPRPALRSVPEEQLAALDGELAALVAALDAARFRDVLASAPRLRARLAALESAPAVLERQAALEIAVATAYTALRRSADAARSMERALRAEPDLALAPEAPPKLQRLLARARTPRSARP